MSANIVKNNSLQVVLHVRRATSNTVKKISMEHMSFRREDELTRRLFTQWEIVGNLGRINSPTSARHRNGLEFIRIWATPPNRLIFSRLAPTHTCP